MKSSGRRTTATCDDCTPAASTGPARVCRLHLEDYQGGNGLARRALHDCSSAHRATRRGQGLRGATAGGARGAACDACPSGVYRAAPSASTHSTTQGAEERPLAEDPTATAAHASDARGTRDLDHGTYPLVGAHAAQPARLPPSGVYQGLPRSASTATSRTPGRAEPRPRGRRLPHRLRAVPRRGGSRVGRRRVGHETYPLVGAHAAQPCEACHRAASTRACPPSASTATSTTIRPHRPDHVAAGFPPIARMPRCRDPSWGDGSFDHGTYRWSALTRPACEACHRAASTRACPRVCRLPPRGLQGAQNPDHVAAGFPTDCGVPDAADPSWGDGSFDHGTYPLVGTHASSPARRVTGRRLPGPALRVRRLPPRGLPGRTDPDHVAAASPPTARVPRRADPRGDGS